jgi:hypothetical protein
MLKMTFKREFFGGGAMTTGKGDAVLGKIVFALTTVAMLVFFWWLLIYDHGVVPVH